MLFYLLSFLLPSTSVDYAVHYGAAYKEATHWVEIQETHLQTQAAFYGIDGQELTAIIFPELLRYSQWRDLLETEALEVAYVEGGSAWADFSIGAFQMKPSFAETLEQKLQQWPLGRSAFQHLLANKNQSLKQQRQARLNRLRSIEGQIDYLCCFYKWMQQRNGFYLVSPTPTQKIALLATAYNTGFWKSWPSLLKASQQHFFPYGARYPQEGQHAYQAIAVAYYQQSPSSSPLLNTFYWPFI
ncbi:MAG: hypothetical protein ACRBFS_02655 [Aureispira sp.]